MGLEVFQALRYCKEVRLFGAGQDLNNHGRFAYPAYRMIPSIHEPGWLEAIAALCQEWRIDYIFPAYDDVIVAFGRARDQLGATLLAPSQDVCELTRSKSLTYHRLARLIRTPKLFDPSDASIPLPVIVKPDCGQGSQGVSKVTDRMALAAALSSVKSPIVCEYLPGEEYTVDCFSDRERGLLFAGARRRNRMRNGIAVNAETVDIPEVREMAEQISGALGMRGAWFFQVKRDVNGALALLEVAPRIAGTMATHRVTGVNFPLLAMFEAERLPLSIRPNTYHVEIDRALGNRYRTDLAFGRLYVDLDDTLVCRGEVNSDLIRLIFQCINERKPVFLITRHKGDLQETMLKHRLSGLFDAVIHVGPDEPKSRRMTGADAIFVDDSFAERQEVSRALGIPTFDCSMVELLLR